MQKDDSRLTREINTFLETVAPAAGGPEDDRHLLLHALSLKPALLTKAFNTTAVPSTPHQQPAFALAECNNLQMIGTVYSLPPGLTAPEIEAYTLALRWAIRAGRLTSQRYTERLGALCTALEDLNPHLRQLTYDRGNAAALFDVAMGVSSGLNTDDIQFFVDGNVHPVAVREASYAVLRSRAEKQVEGQIGWVPSPQTLRKIITQTRKA